MMSHQKDADNKMTDFIKSGVLTVLNLIEFYKKNVNNISMLFS